jgi:hypothetical protein
MKIFCVFLSVLFFLSCASVDSEKSNSPSVSEDVAVNKNEKYASHSMQEQHDTGRWFSGMQDGVFIIIGVSSRLTRPADEIEAAKQDAARKAAMYQGIQGSLISMNTSGAAYFDYSSNSTLNLNYDTNSEQYMERLSYNPDKDVIRGTGATYIRFQYNISGPDVVYISEKSADRPAWTYNRNLPQFPGYTTVIGYAGRRTWMRDTIAASCDSAAARLIESASSQVTTDMSLQYGQGSLTAINIYSEGSLTNFHIMETWIDTASGAVYTLAAARISQ